jgi:RNA polymerase sigma factor (sigma-70 family)
VATTAHPEETSRQKNYFATTHWSVVLKASASDTTRAGEALARLCQTYWYPLYVYVRRRGVSAHDAEDLTQAFFLHLLEKQSLANANPDRGRFRSFILAALNNFLINQWEQRRAQKRGGNSQTVSLDLAAAEKRFDLEPPDNSSPDKIFEKQWALALLDEVLNRLEVEYQSEGKAELFSALKQTLMGSRESQPYAELAAKLKMPEGALKVAVHRLRKRYRELIRSEIANTVGRSDDIDAEMRHLFSALSGR